MNAPMKLINLYGGPGSGKSVAAAALYVGLKNIGMRAALVGEAATELILDGQEKTLLDNQFLVSGMQAERIKRLARSGCKVAISDSPMRLGYHYAKKYSPDIAGPLFDLIRDTEGRYNTIDVFVHRAFDKADTFGRIHANLEAMKAEDEGIYKLCGYYEEEIKGNVEGQRQLIKNIAERLKWYHDTTY